VSAKQSGARVSAPETRQRFRARWLVIALLPLLTHCASAPVLDDVPQQKAMPPGTTTTLDQAIRSELHDEPGVSGVRLIEQNAMAFAYRAATATSAERTLDVQYYIWHDDLTGRLLGAELLRAAERGVRVRILVDDVDARAKHDLFLVVDQHPNVSVRIFNPFYSRKGFLPQLSEILTRGHRLNRRMHNKAWIADNRVAIVGGRNIGDEYFGASDQSNFNDLDVVLAGPIVEDVSREFDEYWNSPNAVPVDKFDGDPPPPDSLKKLIEDSKQYRKYANETPYITALRDVQKRADLLATAAPPLRVTDIELLVDDPAKIGSKETGEAASEVLAGLNRVIADAQKEVLIVSAYFVPGSGGTETLTALVKRGVRVAVLTNSLAATDVAAVHTGYARYRRALLKGGVELYEMKRKVGEERARRNLSVTGSSGSSLHTKASIVDNRWVYIGSMNLDPRSANLNTEMGVLIESAELARQVRALFERNVAPELSYKVVLEEHEGLVWYDRNKGKLRRLEREPDASVWRRLAVTLLRAVPIESQL
jgi:putative cardiolipin synthase